MSLKSEYFTAFLNTAKGCLGTGIISYPYIFQQHGVFYTLLLTFSTCLISLFGCFIYIFINDRKGKNQTMASLSNFSIKKLGLLVNFVISAKCFLLTIIYLDVIKRSISCAIKDSPYLSKISRISSKNIILLFLFCIFFLLIFPIRAETLGSLKKFSFLSILGIIVLFIASFIISSSQNNQMKIIISNPDFITNLGLFVSCFCCHQNIFTIHNESNLTPFAFKFIISLAFFTVSIIYIVFGLLGYSSFKNISPNVLECWPSCLTKKLSCFIYAFTIVFSIPFQIHPIKNNIADAFSLGKKSKDLLGILVFSFSFICAIFDIVKFDTLTKLMSSSMNTLLCFGFPSFYLLTIKIKKSRQYYLMLLFTFLFTLMGLISFLKGLFTHIKKIF